MYKGIIFAVFLVVGFAWQVYAVVNCTATGGGRFGDPVDTTCKNYTYCVYVSSNIGILYLRRRSCKQQLILCYAWQAQCAVNCTSTGAGRFADPDDTTCKNYTLCVLSGSTYLSYNYICPTTSLFNPITAQCTTNYVCTASATTNSTNTTCTAEGYFSDPDSTDCSTYIECVDIDGTYTETMYTCPNNTYFDPNSTLCESNYNCTSSFTCSAAGRFANSSDSTCKTYYFCVLQSDGTYVQYEYTCPTTSVFSPTSRLCTTSYICT